MLDVYRMLGQIYNFELFWLDSKMTHLTKCYSRIDKVLIKKIGNAHILIAN